MRPAHFGVLAFVLIGAVACGRKGEENVGETTTTAGETNEERTAREEAHGHMPGAVPPSSVQAPPVDTTAANADKADGAKATEPSVRHPVTKKVVIVKKRVLTPRPPPEAKEEPTSSVTITEAEIETVPPRGSTTEPREAPRPSATPPGGMPLPPSASGEPYTNHSTVLGDGTSGMYTDGKGTYGGRATWGTGATSRSREP